jgi:hypothetical protein
MTYYISMKKKLALQFAGILLFPAAVLLNDLAHKNPDMTERLYSMGAYRVLSVIFSNLYGIFHISVIELFAYLMLSLLAFSVVFLVISKKNNKKSKRKSPGFLNIVLSAGAAAGVIYFLFISLWGINYNRKTAFEIFGYENTEVTLSRLKEIGDELKDTLNELNAELTQEDLDFGNVINRGNIGYYRIQTIYPELGGNYAQVKPIRASIIMSYFQIWGFYSPFTFEANINTMIPKALIPSTIAHELAHTRGFAREDEANFIAYLTCVNHNDKSYIYSGSLLGFINISNAIRRTDQSSYDELMKKLDPGVIEHLEEIRRFNLRYRGILDELSTKINDLFLKSNRQTDGVLSYGRMVDLMISSRYGIPEAVEK